MSKSESVSSSQLLLQYLFALEVTAAEYREQAAGEFSAECESPIALARAANPRAIY